MKYIKYLGFALILFSIVGGLTIPLGPAIKSFTLEQSDDSTSQAVLIGSNTHFSAATKFALIQKIDNDYFPITDMRAIVKDEKTVQLTFTNPIQFEKIKFKGYVHVVSSDDKDGAMILHEALWIDSSSVHGNRAFDSQLQNADLNKEVSFKCFPNRVILNESIRNLLYHVPMWFAMLAMLFYSLVMSIILLSSKNPEENYVNDLNSLAAVRVGLVFGTLGIITGMLWATYTWGTPWTNDPKLNGAAIGMLVYFAYIILRNSIQDEIKRAKVAAVYNILAFVIYIVFIFIMPKLFDSLHPGNGGNPGFKKYDLDSTLRMYFYPAVVGWIIVGFWIKDMYYRVEELKD